MNPHLLMDEDPGHLIIIFFTLVEGKDRLVEAVICDLEVFERTFPFMVFSPVFWLPPDVSCDLPAPGIGGRDDWGQGGLEVLPLKSQVLVAASRDVQLPKDRLDTVFQTLDLFFTKHGITPCKYPLVTS